MTRLLTLLRAYVGMSHNSYGYQPFGPSTNQLMASHLSKPQGAPPVTGANPQ